jgi:methyl-accepting chemotaxis protein
MRRFAFSRLLLIIVLVPLAGLAVFGGRLTWDSWTRYSDLSRASSVLRLALAAGRFAGSAASGEGSLTRAVIAGSADRSKLPAQRKFTDDLYRDIRDAAGALSIRDPRIDEALGRLDRQMHEVVALRTQVDANTVKDPGISSVVIAPIATPASDIVAIAAAVVSDAELSRRIFAMYTTIEFSQSGTLQRGGGSTALKDGNMSPTAFAIQARAVALHETFGKLLQAYGSRQALDEMARFDATHGSDLASLRKLIMANTGQPASEAQQRRWSEIGNDLTEVLQRVRNRTFDTVAAEGEQMLSAARRDLIVYLAIFCVVIGAVVALSRMVLRTLRELQAELANAMDQMRDGHYDVAIPHVGRPDEIGVMARAVEGFRENFVRVARQDNERKNADAATERKSLLAKLAGDFEAVIGNIVGTVSSASSELATAATTLTQTADTTQKLSATVAAASEEASANVRSVAAATEEMTASVGEIGRQVQESSRISGEAVTQAQSTDDRINKLAQAASRIGDVTQLITSIAEQTNLLALNATIEAARAGVAGKGFAVVAQEVKQLAAQTAKATSEISGQIGEMQAATQDSVSAIKEIGGTIGRISEIATTIASAVEEQGASTQEITRNVQQAAAGTTRVAGNISEVREGAAKTGAASAEVLAAAKSLSEQSGRLKAEVGKFLATVRAA